MSDKKVSIEKVRQVLGNKADGISDEKILEIYAKFQETVETGIEQYEQDKYGITLKELIEGATERSQFLKLFNYYSDKFLREVPNGSKAHTDWLMYSDDFTDFVTTGKLPSGKNVDSN